MDQPYPAIDYSSRSYAELRQAMIDSIPARIPEWTSRSPQDFGIVLIELFATMGDVMSYYADRVANEAFLPTATQRNSVLKLAAGIGYRPRSTAAANALVQFTLDGNLTIAVPVGTLLRSRTSDGSTPVVFSTDVAIAATPTIDLQPHMFTVKVTQGQVITQEQIGTASGVVDQEYVLLQVPVVESSVVIAVRESSTSSLFVWSFIDSLLDARPNDNVYTTSVDASGVVTVTFGDGVNGRIPPASATIYATYRIGGGEVGNVPANTIVEMVSPITGVLSLTNPDEATGGADEESIDTIRVNAPRALKALNRAVTLDDYASLSLQVPQVAKANAEALVYSNVSVYIAPFGGGQPTQQLLNDVVSYLATRKFVGVDVVGASPTYVGIDVSVTVTVDAAYTKSQVQSDVTTAIRNAYDFDNVDFEERVSISALYSVIAAVSGVTAVSLTQLSRQGEFGVTDIVLGVNEIPQPGTVLVTALGGIVAGDPSGVGFVGDATLPVVAGAPVVNNLRCDPTSMHVTLTWTGGANTTFWYVEVQYLNAGDVSIGSVVVGPTTDNTAFEFDIPNNDDAASLDIRIQSFNGGVGPVYSPITNAINVCAV